MRLFLPILFILISFFTNLLITEGLIVLFDGLVTSRRHECCSEGFSVFDTENSSNFSYIGYYLLFPLSMNNVKVLLSFVELRAGRHDQS